MCWMLSSLALTHFQTTATWLTAQRALHPAMRHREDFSESREETLLQCQDWELFKHRAALFGFQCGLLGKSKTTPLPSDIPRSGAVRAVRKIHFSARIENCSNTEQLFSISSGVFLASQRPHHSHLTYHVLLPQTDFACFSPPKKVQNIWQDLDALLSEPPTFSLYDGPKLPFQACQRRGDS